LSYSNVNQYQNDINRYDCDKNDDENHRESKRKWWKEIVKGILIVHQNSNISYDAKLIISIITTRGKH
jgi:hypothetical protein